MDANYPQIQIAEDTATALNQGIKPNTLVQGHVDPSTSLAPFTIIYNKSGNAVASSGYLNNEIPIIAFGALTSAESKSYHFVTWQPQNNVKIAAVSVAANNYYVLSGRSLTEVEKNETKALQIAFLGGIASVVVLGLVFVGMCKTKSS
jgi:hypothetical protein